MVPGHHRQGGAEGAEWVESQVEPVPLWEGTEMGAGAALGLQRYLG